MLLLHFSTTTIKLRSELSPIEIGKHVKGVVQVHTYLHAWIVFCKVNECHDLMFSDRRCQSCQMEGSPWLQIMIEVKTNHIFKSQFQNQLRIHSPGHKVEGCHETIKLIFSLEFISEEKCVRTHTVVKWRAWFTAKIEDGWGLWW